MAGKKIIEFLNRKRQEGFTGCVKMVFEDGRLSHVTEANHLDLSMIKIFPQKAISDIAAMVAERGFCGTVVFFCNYGKPDFYSYTRTYKGDLLEAFLNEGNKGGKRK